MSDRSSIGGTRSRRGVVEADPAVRRSLVVLAVLAALAAAYVAQAVLVPLSFAVVFAAILAPFAAGLRRLRLPAFLAAAVAVAVPLAAVAGAVYLLMPGAEVWRYRLPLFIQTVELKLDGLTDSLSEAREIARQVQQIAANGGDGDGDGGSQAMQVAPEQDVSMSFLWDIPVVMTSAGIAVILALFLLTVAPHQFRRLSRGRPFGARLSRTLAVSGQRLINEISRYYRVVILVNIGLGVATWLALTALGMPEAYLWGIVGGLVNFAPYAGPVVGTGLIAIAALISFDAPLAIALPPLAYVTLTTVEGYFVTPMLVGRSLTLNPMLVLLSVLFWGWLWGVPGAFLAVPLLIFMLRLASFPRALGGRPVRQPADGMFPEGEAR
jgi:predicted PurR-regulated permease PerM